MVSPVGDRFGRWPGIEHALDTVQTVDRDYDTNR